VEIIDVQVSSRPSDVWLERMIEADVPCTVIQDYHDISRDDQARANDYVLTYKTSAGTEMHAQGFPATLSETPAAFRHQAAATPGVHSREILKDAGFSESEIAALFDCGAVQGC
jgi:crotonobetainyl-CoA:carnitine CoA-transferase CaiB-like acyl-CoA transferase